MRDLSIAFCFAILLTSCQTKTTNVEDQPASESTESGSDMKTIIHGLWAQASYISDILKTKSPYKSKDRLGEIVELSIDTTKVKNDTLFIGAPSIHEGSGLVISFPPGHLNALPVVHDYVTTETDFMELSYKIENSETTLVLKKYPIDKKLMISEKYIKVPINSTGALQYMVNKALFAGKYKTTDTSGLVMNVEFTNDGKVTGFPNFKTYYVFTDYTTGPLNNLDQMSFDHETDQPKGFAFVINGDTLNLYETIENEDHINLRLGLLKYELVKQ